MVRAAKIRHRSHLVAFVVGFLAGTVAVLPLAPAAAQDLIVKYDQSQLVRLPRPVAEIIIGNPGIVEVTVQSKDLLIVTGKTFGLTNVIFLDNDRNIIQEQRVMVMRDEARTLHVMKGTKRETYNCSPQCNPSLVAGDDPQYFEQTAKIFEKKVKMTEGAADQNQAAGQ